MENYLAKDERVKYFHENNEDELLIGKFINFLKRKKKKIFSATIGATTLVVLFSYTQKNIWQGNFKILVEESEAEMPSFNNGLN